MSRDFNNHLSRDKVVLSFKSLSHIGKSNTMVTFIVTILNVILGMFPNITLTLPLTQTITLPLNLNLEPTSKQTLLYP